MPPRGKFIENVNGLDRQLFQQHRWFGGLSQPIWRVAKLIDPRVRPLRGCVPASAGNSLTTTIVPASRKLAYNNKILSSEILMSPKITDVFITSHGTGVRPLKLSILH
jgi:hypothetical protein